MAAAKHLTPSTILLRGTPLEADLGGEIVLMSVEAGKYYGLDEIGGIIWRRLETPVRLDTLCAELATDYDAEPAVIERDVLALMAEMVAHGLVEVRS